jgi:very-short-patch-repair endonuclease
MFNYNKKTLEANRKKLRNNLTPAEAALWELIKNKKLDGIEILRFENKLVFKDQEFVLNTIKNKFRDTTPLSSPPRRGLGAPPILGGELIVYL